MPIQKTTEQFIKESKKIYGDNKYDYSLTEYISYYTKIKFIYNGIVYEQSPNSHLSGCKCEFPRKLTQE